MNFNFISARTSQKIMNSIFVLSGILTLAILAIILADILIKGLPVINMEFIFGQVENQGESGGIFPIIQDHRSRRCRATRQALVGSITTRKLAQVPIRSLLVPKCRQQV